MLQTPGHRLPRGGGAGTGIPAQQVCTPPVHTGARGAGGGGAGCIRRGGGMGGLAGTPPPPVLLSLGSQISFFFVKDSPQGPPTANCHPRPTAHRQPLPTATSRQPPTANRQPLK